MHTRISRTCQTGQNRNHRCRNKKQELGACQVGVSHALKNNPLFSGFYIVAEIGVVPGPERTHGGKEIFPMVVPESPPKPPREAHNGHRRVSKASVSCGTSMLQRTTNNWPAYRDQKKIKTFRAALLGRGTWCGGPTVSGGGLGKRERERAFPLPPTPQAQDKN